MAQQKWPTQRLTKWAEEVLTEYRRHLSKEGWQGEADREAGEAKMGQSLARWLGSNKP